ncbi:MAG: glycosyltransferase [Gaiellaceae bacterium]
MILVTVGTNETSFDRLLRALEALPETEELVVQHGPSGVRPPRATCFDYLPFDELTAYMRRARVVVTHAGVGSIIAALSNGKRAIVVPRLARHGEAVDDHQLHFGRRAEQAGLVELVEDPATLAEAVARHEQRPVAEIGGDNRLVEDLREYLSARIGR